MSKRFSSGGELCELIYESEDESTVDFPSESENEMPNDNEPLGDPSEDGQWSLIGSKRYFFPFIGISGVQLKETNPENVLEIFESIQNEKIIAKIVAETNAHANEVYKEKRLSGSLKKKSRVQNWKDTNIGQIRVLDALFLLMGIIKKPDFQLYFTREPILSTPFFGEVISRDKFLLLVQYLHFSSSKDTSDKLHKIRELQRLYIESFQSAYFPEKIVYLKRGRFGIEGYFLCESKTGYVYNFEIDTGKRTNLQVSPYAFGIPARYLSYSTNIVLRLMANLLNMGFFLALDNYFASPTLFGFLASHMTDAVGTLRENQKGIPKEALKAKLKKGQDITMYKGKLMIMRWSDKKDIMMISTIHDSERKLVKEFNVKKNKPIVSIDYEEMMGSWDQMNDIISSHNSTRSHMRKYYTKIYLMFLDIAALNAFVIHKKLGGKYTFLKFKTELIRKLIEKYGESTTSTGRYAPLMSPNRLTGRHFPRFTKSKEGKPGRSSLRCQVCSSKGRRKESTYMCEDCGVGLCIVPCFEIYHTKMDFHRH